MTSLGALYWFVNEKRLQIKKKVNFDNRFAMLADEGWARRVTERTHMLQNGYVHGIRA